MISEDWILETPSFAQCMLCSIDDTAVYQTIFHPLLQAVCDPGGFPAGAAGLRASRGSLRYRPQ
jgi:hypothetical protein